MRKYFIILLFSILILLPTSADEYLYILEDKRIENVYIPASDYFKNTNISIIKEAQGIILRFIITNPISEYNNLSDEMILNLNLISNFLAKIKNPVIIEVHAGDFSKEEIAGLKNWEVSAVIAGNIEQYLFNLRRGLDKNRITSVGYGEFIPVKNTPNNGGKYTNRVDIIILCNITGE